MKVIKTLIKEINEIKYIEYRKIINKVLTSYFLKVFLLRKNTYKITFKGKYIRSPLLWIFKVIKYHIKLIIANIFKILKGISSKILPKNSNLYRRILSYVDRQIFIYTDPRPDIYRYSPIVDENYLEYILKISNLKLVDEKDILLKGKIVYTISKS